MKTFEGFLSKYILKIKDEDIEIGDKLILRGSYAGLDLNGKESKVLDINQNPKHLYHKKLYVIKVPVEFNYNRYTQSYRSTVIKTIEIPIDNIQKVIKRKTSPDDPYGEEDWDDTNEGFLKNYKDRNRKRLKNHKIETQMDEWDKSRKIMNNDFDFDIDEIESERIKKIIKPIKTNENERKFHEKYER